MTETIVTVKILHTKPLPKEALDTIAQRTYSYLYARGCEAGVTAALAQMPKEPGKEHE